MSFESKSESSTRSSTIGVIIAAALVSALVSVLVSGVVAVGVTKGWFPIVSIYAAGVPSTVQVIDSVDLNTDAELEVVVYALTPPEELTVRVRVLGTGAGRVADPGSTTYATTARKAVLVADDDGTSVRFPIRSDAQSDTTYAIEVSKTNGGAHHDRQSITVRFR